MSLPFWSSNVSVGLLLYCVLMFSQSWTTNWYLAQHTFVVNIMVNNAVNLPPLNTNLGWNIKTIQNNVTRSTHQNSNLPLQAGQKNLKGNLTSAKYFKINQRFKSELIELVLVSWTMRTEEWSYPCISQSRDRRAKETEEKKFRILKLPTAVQYIVLYQVILKN